MLNNKKSNFFMIGIILLFTIYYIIYLQLSTVNVAWLTWFFHLPLVDKFFSGTLHISDLVNRYGEHGMLGYNSLFILNAKLFHLNTFFDVYLHVFLIAISSYLIFLSYKETIIKSNINIMFFAAMMFVMYSITQQSTGGMDTQVRLGLYFYLFTSFIIDAVIHNKKKLLIPAIIMLFISINIFGTFYSLANIPSFIGIFLFQYYKSKKINISAIFLTVSLIISWILYLYMYSIFGGEGNSEGTILNGFVGIFQHPIKSILFLLAFMSSSVFGRTLFQDFNWSDSILIFSGGIITALYIYCLVKFFKKEMWKKTYLPLMLMIYSVGVMGLVLLGRNQMGWDGGTNYWYAVHTKLGIIGCIWILSYSLSDKKGKIISYVLVAFVTAALIVSNAADWKRAPHVKNYFLNMIPYMFSNDIPVDNNGMTPLINDLATTEYGINILKKYNLNVFYDQKGALGLERLDTNGFIINKGEEKSGLLGSGWYSKENGYRWVNKESNFQFQSGDFNKLIIEGAIPISMKDNTIMIYQNQSLVEEKNLSAGDFQIQLDIPTNQLVNIKITFSNSFIPKKTGSNDERELAATIKNIYVRKGVQ